MAGIHPNRTVLAHWTYQPDEWHSFRGWLSRKKGRLAYFSYRLFSNRRPVPPEVTVTNGSIWTNDMAEFFNTGGCRLQSISIRDAGEMNVMGLRYLQAATGQGEINLLIPRGKLREAIELQELLADSIAAGA